MDGKARCWPDTPHPYRAVRLRRRLDLVLRLFGGPCPTYIHTLLRSTGSLVLGAFDPPPTEPREGHYEHSLNIRCSLQSSMNGFISSRHSSSERHCLPLTR